MEFQDFRLLLDNLVEGCTTVQGEDGDETNEKTQMMTNAHLIYLMMMNEIHAHNLLFFFFFVVYREI